MSNNGMNKVFLLGNLGADPELLRFESGAKMKFRLATNETWRDRASHDIKERTTWHNLTMWGPRADALSKILKKGTRVMVEGRLETRSYESQGTTKYVTEVKVDDLFFAGGPRPAREDASGEVDVEFVEQETEPTRLSAAV